MSEANIRERLEARIASSGIPLGSLTPAEGLDLILRCYGEDPSFGLLFAVWCKVSRYGDEELGFQFQWHHNSPESPKPGSPSDFSWLFMFGPEATIGDPRGFMVWCSDADDILSFRSTIETSEAFQRWGHSQEAEVRLLWDDVTTSAFALFDCWGARDPSRPIVSMTEEEWLRSDDVPLMLRWLRQEWAGKEADLDRLLQRYFLATCRRIWKLIPMERSRWGIETTERYIEGKATLEEFAEAEWHSESASWDIDKYGEFTETVAVREDAARDHREPGPKAYIELLTNQVKAIPHNELSRMVRLTQQGAPSSSYQILRSAACFANTTMVYPGIKPKEGIERYQHFLFAPLLREIVGSPFRSDSDQVNR